MLDRWKKRRQTAKQIKELEDRIRRSAEVENANMIGFAVANYRGQIALLRGYERRSETERLIARALKYDITIPQFDEYWETDEASKTDCLTVAGKKLVINGIRDKRFALFQRWSPIIAILISILSLIVAVIARSEEHTSEL